jgi:hypothetical protein
MTDDWMLPDWDRPDLLKRAGLDARLQEMIVQHLDNDPTWAQTVRGLADDLTADDKVREMLARFCVVVENLWSYGRQEAVEHFRNNRDTASF